MAEPHETALLARTKRLLAEAEPIVTAKAISQQTGLSRAWLSRFKTGKIPNPGVVQVQTLHDYLAGLK